MNELIGDREVSKRSGALAGKRILLVVTGGIASIVAPQLARELRRHGASVEAAMTPAARRFIAPLTLEWATGQPVLTGLTGRAEQVFAQDLVLVAPCTLDTLGKISSGIADNAALTSIAAALGRATPLLLAPTMHETLWRNPLFQENLERLTSRGLAQVVAPLMEEGKAKMPPLDHLMRAVRRALSRSSLRGRSILITAGPTRAPIDEVRHVENRSSGRLGCALAAELDARGADVTLVYGPGTAEPPPGVRLVRVETPRQMLDSVMERASSLKPFAGIFAAAVLDYVPSRAFPGKISSAAGLQIQFEATPKIVQEVDRLNLNWIKVGFKLEAGLTDQELLERGEAFLQRSGCRAVVCNHHSEVQEKEHRAALLSSRGVQWIEGREAIVWSLAMFLEDLAQFELPVS